MNYKDKSMNPNPTRIKANPRITVQREGRGGWRYHVDVNGLAVLEGWVQGRQAEARAQAWEANALEPLHTGFLRRTLGMLSHPSTETQLRADILAWVNAPLRPAGAVPAFSFQACLYCYDPRIDPETMQALVLGHVNRLAGRAAQPIRRPS